MSAITLQSINIPHQPITAPKFTSKSAEIFYKVDKSNLSDPQLRSSMDSLCSRVSTLEVMQKSNDGAFVYHFIGAAIIITGLALVALTFGLTLGLTGGVGFAMLSAAMSPVYMYIGLFIIMGILVALSPDQTQKEIESLQDEINSSVRDQVLNNYLVNHSEELKEKLQNAISLKQTDLESRVVDATLEKEIAQLQKAITDLETLVQLAKSQDLKSI